MFNIRIDKECGCFRRSNFENNIQFDNREDALKEAEAMTEDMNDTFCNKHEFSLEAQGNEFIIIMSARD